jgi:hypothetical protein
MTRKYELVNCNVCNEEYKRYAQSKTGCCNVCRSKIYQDKYRQLRLGKSEITHFYPLGYNEQKRRYTRLRNELNACQTREELKAFYDTVITEMIESGIWDWCISKSDKTETRRNIDENGNAKVGRISDKQIEYPNTKEMPD